MDGKKLRISEYKNLMRNRRHEMQRIWWDNGKMYEMESDGKLKYLSLWVIKLVHVPYYSHGLIRLSIGFDSLWLDFNVFMIS